MPLDRYDLTSDEGVHKLTRSGASRASVVIEGTKREALQDAAAYMRAHGGTMRVHNEGNGRISEERTYPRSADPRRSKG